MQPIALRHNSAAVAATSNMSVSGPSALAFAIPVLALSSRAFAGVSAGAIEGFVPDVAHPLRRRVHFASALRERPRVSNFRLSKAPEVEASRLSRTTWSAALAVDAGSLSRKDDTEKDEPRDEVRSFTVLEDHAGARMDRVLTAQFPGQSRSYFQVLIDQGLVSVNGNPMTVKKRKAIPGDEVKVDFITPQHEMPLTAEDIPLDVLYEDEHIVIINKNAGMVVHPAPGNWTGTMVHALAWRYSDHLALGGPRPGIVHRLDKGTSGVIVAARTERAHRLMTGMFAAREVEKTYLAISVGNPAGEGCSSCVLDSPIGRSPMDHARMAVVEESAGGKRARSVVSVRGSDARGLLHIVEIGLETGRTHQIRVHLRNARAPVLGDDLYGAADVNRRFKSAASRPLLHAHRLKFRHPVNGEIVDVAARLPEDMLTLLQRGGVYPGFETEHPSW
jgi:23S rRNA pseudouridine1911/1915/1917 synthase